MKIKVLYKKDDKIIELCLEESNIFRVDMDTKSIFYKTKEEYEDKISYNADLNHFDELISIHGYDLPWKKNEEI